MIRGGGLLLLVVLPGGCVLFDAHQQITQMESACVIAGTVRSAGEATKGPYVVAAVRETGPEGELPMPVDHVLTGVRGEWFFALAPGRYSVLAFRDTDADLSYRAGEPVHHVDGGDPIECAEGERHTPIEIVIRKDDRSLHPLTLSPSRELPALANVPLPVVSLGQLTTFGEVTGLDDPRFAPEVARDSLWRPLDFLRAGHAGVYFLEPYDPQREPVLLIHGINGSPRVFDALIERLDRERFQAWLYFAPSGLPLQASASYLAQVMEELEVRHGVRSLRVVAHSMGGLVAQAFLQEREAHGATAQVTQLITLATPWQGSDGALHGVQTSPLVLPVWRDIATGSDFLDGLFAPDSGPAAAEFHLVFAYQSDAGRARVASDGLVRLSSMLPVRAQSAAASVFGVEASHAGILRHPDALAWLESLLAMDPAID